MSPMYIERAPIAKSRTIQPAPAPAPMSQNQQNISNWRAKVTAYQQNMPKKPTAPTRVYFTPN